MCILNLKNKVPFIFYVFAALIILNQVYPAAIADFKTKNPEGASLVITAGDYRLRFAEKTSWTFREGFFKDKPFLAASGFQQPVLHETGLPAGTESFLGSGHRNEHVELIELNVNDSKNSIRTFLIEKDISIESGDSYTVHKKSKFISEFHGLLYDHESWVTIDRSGIKEDYYFKVPEKNIDNVDYMYVFMHIFPNTTKYWIVGDNTKEMERGEFIDDNSFCLHRDFRFAMIYDPVQLVGVSYVYPEIYSGSPGFKNAFWNRPRDNKLYLRINPKRLKGEEFRYSVNVRAYASDEKSWEKDGKIVIDRIIGVPVALGSQNRSGSNSGISIIDNIRFDFETDNDLDLAAGDLISDVLPYKGKGSLEIKGDNSPAKMKKISLVLEPKTKYKLTGAVRKGENVSEILMRSTFGVMNYTPDNKLEMFALLGADVPRDNKWHTVTGTFTTSENVTKRAGLILYNKQSLDSVWFDEIIVEKLKSENPNVISK